MKTPPDKAQPTPAPDPRLLRVVRVALWACLLLTLPVVLEFWLRVQWQGLFRQPWAIAYVLAPIGPGVLPYLLAIWGIRRQRYRVTALELATVVGAVGLLYWSVAFYASQTGGMDTGFRLQLGEPENILSGLLMVTHLVLSLSAGKAALKRGVVGLKLKGTSCFVTGPLALGILLVIGAVLIDLFQGPSQQRQLSARIEAKAISELRNLNAALAAYADTYPHQRFPATLAVLGPPPKGSQPSEKAADLVDPSLPAGRLKVRYWIRYIPGPPDQKGRVTTYRVMARPLHLSVYRHGDAGVGVRSFYTDESGVIRVTRENRVAAKSDDPL